MGLFTKAKIATGNEALEQAGHTGDLDTGTFVSWVTYCQPDLQAVAKLIDWQPSEQHSAPFLVEVKWDAAGPKGGGYKVTAAGKTLGYTSRAQGPHTKEGKRVARLFEASGHINCLLLNP